MWLPKFLQRKPSAFESELQAVKALPEPRRDIIGTPVYDTAPLAPVIPPPVDYSHDQSFLARPPIIDRFPIVIGANLNGAVLSSGFRLCNSGWRFQYVDLLDELLENDPDARAVVRARILGVASGRYTIEAAELGEMASDADRDLAATVANQFALEFSNIPFLRQALQRLAWADWYGVSALEVKWETADKRWSIVELGFIHNRRLNYTDPVSWNLYIYDQGLVGPGSDYMGPTVGVHGLCATSPKYAGKFIIHTPALSGQYPTRDGEGRYVAFYMLLKRMVVRCTGQDFERVIRPWVLGYYNRAVKAGHELPVAAEKDILALDAAMAAFGAGSMNSASLPNTVKVELLRAVAAMSATEFLSFLNRSIAKALLGQAFTTEPGPNGNLATAEVADGNTSKVLEYSANALAETIREHLVRVWMRLNHPNLPRHFCPRVIADVSNLPGPEKLIAIAKTATDIGLPVDRDDLAARTTLKLTEDESKSTRAAVASKPFGQNDAPQEQSKPSKVLQLKPKPSEA